MSEIRQFTGLFSDHDPHDLKKGGAQVQENLMCLTPGRLTVRKGIRPIMCDNAAEGTAVDTADVVALCSISTRLGSYVVFLNTDGDVKYGKDPI